MLQIRQGLESHCGGQKDQNSQDWSGPITHWLHLGHRCTGHLAVHPHLWASASSLGALSPHQSRGPAPNQLADMATDETNRLTNSSHCFHSAQLLQWIQGLWEVINISILPQVLWPTPERCRGKQQIFNCIRYQILNYSWNNLKS